VVPSVLANHIGMARGLFEASAIKRELDIMRNSNRTSAEFANARARLQMLVAGAGGWSRVARAVEGGASERSATSNDYSTMGRYTADRLPVELRRYVGHDGCDAHHVAGVGNYLVGLGMQRHEVHQYAGYFVGSSQTVRTAIRNHIRSGQRLMDEHVTNAHDARAIIGAIRAGRIRREDAPPSVQRLMEQMQQQGIDPATADARAIQGYFEQNPQALETARREARERLQQVRTELRQTGTTTEAAFDAAVEALDRGPQRPAVVSTETPTTQQPSQVSIASAAPS
jgi:hypothetical protein